MLTFVIPVRFLAVFAALLVIAYFGAYYHLSRRGDEWCRPFGFCGFLYVLPDDGKDWYEWHQLCRVAFTPANELDRALGGQLHPVQSICCFGPSK
jgi:hypothetical protein